MVVMVSVKLTTTYITPKITGYLYILWPVITPGWVNYDAGPDVASHRRRVLLSGGGESLAAIADAEKAV